MIACENSGYETTYDVAEVSKIVEAGVTRKSIKDYELTRYACYLIIQKTAHDAGVIINEEFSIFQNVGYMGLHGGLDVEDIYDRKDLTAR